MENDLHARVFRLVVSLTLAAWLPGCSGSQREALPQAVRGTIDLTTTDLSFSPPVELSGEWARFPGLLATNGETLTNEGHRMLRSLPDAPVAPWSQRIAGTMGRDGRVLGRHGCATQVLRVRLPARKKHSDLGLLVTDYSTATRTWSVSSTGTVRLLAAAGRVSCIKGEARAALENRVVPVQAAEIEYLIVERANFWTRDVGGGKHLLLGSFHAVEQHANAARSRDFWSIGFLSIIGIYHVLLFALRSSLRAALWLGVWCLLSALRVYLVGRYAQTDFGWGSLSLFLFRLEYLTLPLISLLASLYTRGLFGRAVAPLLYRSTIVYAGLACAFTVVVPPSVFTQALVPLQLSIGLTAAWFVIQVGTVSIAESDRVMRTTARILAVASVALIAAVLHDIFAAHYAVSRPFLAQYGQVIFMLGQAYLIARQNDQAHRAAEQLGIELKRLDAVKDDFLANLSHELRTPLTVVHGYAEMLADRGGETAAMSHEILSGSARLSECLDDLLLVTEIDSALGLANDTVELSGLVQELVADPGIAGAAKERLIEIMTDVAPGTQISGDQRLLRKALRAPLLNGILYNTEGGSLRITVGSDADQLLVQFEDTGVGIARQHLPFIWDRFYRVDRSNTYGITGVGLGLYICRHIVAMHGGECAVLSTPGAGTRISLQFPARSGAKSAS